MHIYKNEDGYRVLAKQYKTGKKNSIKDIQELVELPVSFINTTPPTLRINYENVYPNDWVVKGIGQIEFEIVTNADFKKRYKLHKWMKMKR